MSVAGVCARARGRVGRRVSVLVVLTLMVAAPPALWPVGAAAAGASRDAVYLDARRPVDERVRDLLGRMTLAEKVGQMTQAERGAATSDPDLVRRLGLGSVLSGGGSVPTPNT